MILKWVMYVTRQYQVGLCGRENDMNVGYVDGRVIFKWFM